MKKVLSTILVLCMVFALCAGGTSAFAAKDVTVVGSRWAGPNADVQKELVKDYENGKIVIDDVDYNNLKEKQILSMSASGEYDLIWVPEVWLGPASGRVCGKGQLPPGELLRRYR